MKEWRKPDARGSASADSEPTLSQLLFRDFIRLDDARAEGAARERVRALDPVPGFFLAVHVICAVALLDALRPGTTAALTLLAPLGGLLVGDLTLWAWVRRRPFSVWRPHIAVRSAALYAMLANAAWCAVITMAGGRASAPLTVDMALVCGTLAVPIGFLSFPALVGLGSLSCVTAFYLIWGDAPSAAAAALLSLAFVGLSLQRAESRQDQIRRRLESEWNAQRATRFVEEFEQAGHGWFWETSARGALTYVSEQLAADLEMSARALIGRGFTDLIDASGVESSERTLGFHLSARLPFTDIRVRAAGMPEISWSLSGTPSFDEHGRFLGFRGIGADLTQQHQTEAEINRLARYDSLTGLPNRALMRRTLEDALGNAPRPDDCALFLIDLDRFKNVNDTLGHPIGDALLKQVGHRLESAIGARGQIGRLGGDEFKAVLLGQDEASLALLAERLIQQVSMPYMIEGHNIAIGASVGIAVATAGEGGDALVRNADLALYSAKAAGRGTFAFFAPEMHSDAQDRQLLENDLRKAIGRGELELFFQPVVHATSEALAGFEALVRWNHPARGSISPSLFVPLAEEAGLILQIGEWVLRQACAEAARWPEHIRIAVNLSPIQFTDPSLPGTILSALASADLPPRQLELEITEGVFLVESEATDDMFTTLKSIGVRLALDDFGTGYSSLGYLKKTPFDKIKIDQSFVRGAAKRDSRNAAIVRAIVTLAESLGMDTTAEGAETHDELTLIRELGCSHVQGFIFGRPMPAGEALALAQQNEAISADGFQFNRPPRQGLLKVASLQWNGVTMSVKIRNLSTGGALVECGRGLPVGASVQLDLPGCDPLGAQVRWSEGRRTGLQFDEEFDLRRLAPRKAAAQGAARRGGVLYPNFRHAEDGPTKRRLARGDLRS